MPEHAALKLTGLGRAAFEEAHADGSLQLPPPCNARAGRLCSAGARGQIGASQLGAFWADWRFPTCLGEEHKNLRRPQSTRSRAA